MTSACAYHFGIGPANSLCTSANHHPLNTVTRIRHRGTKIDVDVKTGEPVIILEYPDRRRTEKLKTSQPARLANHP
jgi:hypothetical protein